MLTLILNLQAVPHSEESFILSKPSHQMGARFLLKVGFRYNPQNQVASMAAGRYVPDDGHFYEL
ncbi:MAG: hypothetical protein ACI9DJ_002063 [Algoriphagus sp.]|jgi:hypothetical protein